MANPHGVSHVPSINPSAVSVLIVNYRAYGELAVCLQGLLTRSAHSPQIVVVDHSTSPAELSRVQAQFPSVVWVPSAENPGFAAGVNRAAAAASGDFLLLLNPDCIVDQDVCGVLAAWLAGNRDFGVVGSLIRDHDGTIQASARRFPGLTTGFAGRTSWLTRLLPNNPFTLRNLLTGPDVTEPTAVDWVSGACMMVRRAAFNQVGGMDERFFLYWEDADLCRRLATSGWRTGYNPRVSVTHLCGRSSRASARSIRAFHQSAFRYFLKHGGLRARLAAPFAYLALWARMVLKLLRSAD